METLIEVLRKKLGDQSTVGTPGDLINRMFFMPSIFLKNLIAITKLNFFILFTKFFVRHFGFVTLCFVSVYKASLELSDKPLLNNKNKRR